MTWIGLLIGLVLMGGGFIMVWRAAILEQWIGEVGMLLGFQSLQWITWQTTGILFLLLGFLIATGLLGDIFNMFFGGFFFARPPGTI